LIGLLSRTYGVQNRVRYIHDQHLPTLLEHARGVVVVNSTVGLSALHHGTPVKICGTAIYDIEGLTFQGTLDDFWDHACELTVDHELFKRFRSYVIKHTQLNGSYYRRLKIADSRAGLVWPLAFDEKQSAGGQGQPAMPGCPADSRIASADKIARRPK
jgi:capsular polysaccharide export protein